MIGNLKFKKNVQKKKHKAMRNSATNPRVLIVTPEVTYLPKNMGSNFNSLNAKAGGLADVSAALINALYHQG